MPLLLVVLLVVVPLIEIGVIVQAGQVLGVGWTIFLLVADSVVGAVLLRVEGRRAWSDFRSALAAGRWPGDEVAQGAMIILGGALLLTPGFVTDAVGFLLLIGPMRSLVSRVARRRIGDLATGRGSRDRRGPAERPSRGERDRFDVEVVEIEREQRSVEDGPDDGEDPGPGPAR